MRILFNLHLFVPDHRCGSEYYAYHTLQYLKSKGHHVRVVLNQAKQNGINVPYIIDGIEVFGPSTSLDQYRWADIILTHLDYTKWSVQIGAKLKIPVVFFAHNDIPYGSVHSARYVGCPMHVVYNSHWMIPNCDYQCPSMVMHPPTDWRYYDVCEDPSKNKFITLISLNDNKGGNIFYQIAEAMPDRQFLGVTGSYDKQILRTLPNVTVVPKGEILQYYRQTRLLLMPSRYESWGMTATEAMCSGIPVICTPTYGLKENCDYAGNYIPQRKDVPQWVRKIKEFDSPEYYEKRSTLARQRSRELDPQVSLAKLEEFLTSAVYAHA
jgi:glycosyltransferase involved in cell wall biosynthesis